MKTDTLRQTVEALKLTARLCAQVSKDAGVAKRLGVLIEDLADLVETINTRGLTEDVERQYGRILDRLATEMPDAAIPPTPEWPRKRLLRRQQSGNVDNMVSSHKLAISAGRSHGNPLAEASRAHSLTLGDLAKRVGVSKSLLSKAMIGKLGLRRITAAKIEKLTGYSASNWPRLID